MPFDFRNLSCLAYANKFTAWHYRTADPAEAVFAVSYFSGAKEMFAQGDLLIVTSESWAGQFYTDISNGNVRLATFSYINLRNQPLPTESSLPPANETPEKAAD